MSENETNGKSTGPTMEIRQFVTVQLKEVFDCKDVERCSFEDKDDAERHECISNDTKSICLENQLAQKTLLQEDLRPYRSPPLLGNWVVDLKRNITSRSIKRTRTESCRVCWASYRRLYIRSRVQVSAQELGQGILLQKVIRDNVVS